MSSLDNKCGWRQVSHHEDPYADITFETSDVTIKGGKDKPDFVQKGVSFPSFYSETSRKVVANKYFYGTRGSREREHSMAHIVDRVSAKLATWGEEQGYFPDGDRQREEFFNTLRFTLINQYAAFNSPVWFNLGTPEPQQASACFINSVEDSIQSIINLGATEMMVFKGGSGAGVNVSRLRGKQEPLKGGGVSSGPLSFMRAWDEAAGSIKSGGKTRRAAKMVVMDVDHPDIMEFIACKGIEEKKAQALIAAGFDGSFDAENGAYATVAFQNANHSVCMSDEFMDAVVNDDHFRLEWRTDPSKAEVVKARNIMSAACQSCWESGDPGVQFGDTINKWHTCPNDGRIVASNPCSEYFHLNDTSCNLASLNLMRFVIFENGRAVGFDFAAFYNASYLMALALDIIIDKAHYPTEQLAIETKKSRTIGLGFANLGAVIMALGLPYGSKEACRLAATITHVMNAAAYIRSANTCLDLELAPFERLDRNREAMSNVLGMHAEAFLTLRDETDDKRFGLDSNVIDMSLRALSNLSRNVRKGANLRNAQATVLAPTGTISFMMGCDTTGVEPVLGLVSYKQLVGGGFLKLTLDCTRSALLNLGYSPSETEEALCHIEDHDSLDGFKLKRSTDAEVFKTSFSTSPEYTLDWKAHVDMMAACQPALSGAISKTVNINEDATPKDIEDITFYSWRAGLKSVAIYRNNCKQSQPLTLKSSGDKNVEDPIESLREHGVLVHGERRRLEKTRKSRTHTFSIGGQKGYIIIGEYEDGSPGEIFINFAKMGSTARGFVDSFAIGLSLGLQYGVPLEVFHNKYRHMSFSPSGFTDNPEIRKASSIPDYVLRWVAQEYFNDGAEERDEAQDDQVVSDIAKIRSKSKLKTSATGDLCSVCGGQLVQAGTCHTCTECGSSTGCG